MENLRSTLVWRRLAAALALLAIAAPGVSWASAGDPTGLTVDELRARYTGPQSRFVTLGGLNIHYVDEGEGPVVLLLHGSYLDQQSWQDWSDNLAKDHRVIRVDRLRFGLTGVYPGEPVDYAHEQRMLDDLVAHLKLSKVSVAGSSSGGIVAAQFADRHPEMVDKLILMNFPLGHARIQGGKPDPKIAGRQTASERTVSLLEKNLTDDSLIQPALVERMTAMNNRRDESGAIGAAYALAAGYSEADRAQMLARLKMPVLVLWSADNATLPVEAGRAGHDALGSRAKSFVVVAEAGHMMPLEKGQESAALGRAFLEKTGDR